MASSSPVRFFRNGIHPVPFLVLLAAVLFRVLTNVSAQETGRSRPAAADPGAAVVSLRIHDQYGSPAHHATGFFISRDGVIASTRHVLEDVSKLVAVASDGRAYTVTAIVAEHPVHDLALLRVEATGTPHLKLGTFDVLKLWAPVTVVKNREFGGGRLVEGTVDVIENLADDYKWFSLRGRIEEGQSGCPVVNGDGVVLGMIRAHLNENTRGFAVSVDAIRELYEASQGRPGRPVRTFRKQKHYELFDNLDLKAGLAAMGRGNTRDAIPRMKLAAEGFPESGAVHVLLGSMYSRISAWPKAREAFQDAVKRKPDYAFAWASLGAVLGYEGKRAEAMKACKVAEGLNPKHPDTWFNIGTTQVLLGDLQAAKATIATLRKLGDANSIANAERLEREIEQRNR